jgi:threonine dehydratase
MAVEAPSISLSDVRAAAERIAPFVLPTPLLPAPAALGEAVWFKAESLQRTGSFKVRGAINAVLQLTPDQRRRGVITLSAGNHGRALAYAAQRFGIPCVVVIRDDAPVSKLQAIRAYGAEVVLVPREQWQARLEAEQAQRELHLVHPFDDVAVVAGHGTLGLEILEARPDVETVVVPVGGGGLIAGVAVTVKEGRPAARVIGVEPEGAPILSESLAAGHPVAPSRGDTIAEGLAPPYTRPFNLAIAQRLVDEMRLVSDTSIIDALRLVALEAKLVLEPSGAAGVAGFLANPSVARPAVIVLSGGNVDRQQLATWLG